MKANSDVCFWLMLILALGITIKGYAVAASIYFVGAMLFKAINDHRLSRGEVR